MKSNVLAGSSLRALAAIAFASATALHAHAQQTDASPEVSAAAEAVDQIEPPSSEADSDSETRDRIVITGTNIRATAESAALPVDVFMADETFKSGGQNTLEFIKSLSIVGEQPGETNAFGGGTAGTTNINLRGLGGGRTLPIFNGRRFNRNITFIPQAAVERTEILKDGGAVIYGADATGGVVNFITRTDFEGLELQTEYKAIEDSDGDYNASLVWGRNFGQSNILASLEYAHRSELDVSSRDWAIKTYQENPSAFTPYHTYARYRLNVPTSVVPSGNGGLVTDFTTSECESSGGLVPGFQSSVGGQPVCWWNYAIQTFNLVEEQDVYKGYLQFKTDVSDTLRFTSWVSYGKSQIDNLSIVPAYNVNVGPAPATGGTFEFRIPRSNPGFDTFLAQNASQISPTVASSVTSADQFFSIFFGPGGAPHLAPGQGSGTNNQLENWNMSAALDGEFGGIAGDWLDTWSLAATYNLNTTTIQNDPQLVGYRVQQALNGFGGPNCAAADLVPDNFSVAGLDANGNGVVSNDEFYAVVGTQNPGAAGQNGCYYLNPFSSNYAANAATGTPNPRYVSGLENNPEMTRWLFPERLSETALNTFVIDALVSGALPISLPGGDIGWAMGAQWRQEEERRTASPLRDLRAFPCAWPGQDVGDVGCPAAQGALTFSTPDALEQVDQQQYSIFTEAQIPVLDNLSFQVAVRREEFPSAGLNATVYKVAGKWDPLDWLAVRGSFGTNYSTPPTNFRPGEISAGTTLVAAAGNRYIRALTQTSASVEPETAEVGNFGIITNFHDTPLFGGSIRASIDYFNFKIIDEIKTVSHNTILNSVFVATAGANNPINCAAPLIDRILFVNGNGAAGCSQGVTVGNDVLGISSVRGNGPGLQTSGIDYDVQYSVDAFGGELSVGASATQILEATIDAFTLDGVQLSADVDALGFANYSRDGELTPEWRANSYVNFNIGNHNIRYAIRYIQGVTDDRVQNAIAGRLREIDASTISSLYYQYTLPFDENFTISASVDNLFDEDPPFTIQQYSYDPMLGSPLGRTFEIGLRKTF